jgi:hypothetical protein
MTVIRFRAMQRSSTLALRWKSKSHLLIVTVSDFVHKNVFDHPLAKWIANNAGWGFLLAGVALAKWDEYAVALVLFVSGSLSLFLKAYHWRTESKALKVVLVLLAFGGIMASWPVTVAKKGTKPWSDAASRWTHIETLTTTEIRMALARLVPRALLALETPTPQEPALPVVPSPDVTLRFVYPKSPALLLVDSPKALARDIKWEIALWNMDLPERNDPLPIPASTFDWLRPGDNGGPENLFSSSLVAPLLKPGNRLFGSATVICPNCQRGHTYIVYIVWDEGGWFYEVKNEKSGHLIVPRKFGREYRDAYFQALENAVPEAERILIADIP